MATTTDAPKTTTTRNGAKPAKPAKSPPKFDVYRVAASGTLSLLVGDVAATTRKAAVKAATADADDPSGTYAVFPAGVRQDLTLEVKQVPQDVWL